MCAQLVAVKYNMPSGWMGEMPLCATFCVQLCHVFLGQCMQFQNCENESLVNQGILVPLSCYLSSSYGG